MDERFGKTGNVTEDGRGERVARIGALQIVERQHRQHLDIGREAAGPDVLHIGAARHGEVGPGTERNEARRKRRTLVAKHHERRKCNARPGGIAHHDNLRGRNALREKRAIDGGDILDGEGKGMFGRQPILGNEDPASRVARDGVRDDEVHGTTIHGEGAAIDIEDHRRRLVLRRLTAPDGRPRKSLRFPPIFPRLDRLVHFALPSPE